jgi:hypothetical protein
VAVVGEGPGRVRVRVCARRRAIIGGGEATVVVVVVEMRVGRGRRPKR